MIKAPVAPKAMDAKVFLRKARLERAELSLIVILLCFLGLKVLLNIQKPGGVDHYIISVQYCLIAGMINHFIPPLLMTRLR